MEFGNKEDLAKMLIGMKRDLVEEDEEDSDLCSMWDWTKVVRVSRDHIPNQSEYELHAKIRWYQIPFDLFPQELRPRW